MDKIEKIRQEIERRLNILTNVYDELMERKDEEMMTYYHGKVIALEELCPFLDTLSEEPDKSLEEAAEEYSKRVSDGHNYRDLTCGFVAGAEWMKEQDDKETADLLTIAHLQGADQMKEQMMKGAVEGEIMTNGLYPYEPRIVASYPDCPYQLGDKVKLIIVKEEGE